MSETAEIYFQLCAAVGDKVYTYKEDVGIYHFVISDDRHEFYYNYEEIELDDLFVQASEELKELLVFHLDLFT